MKQEDGMFGAILTDDPAEFLALLEMLNTDGMGHKSYTWTPVFKNSELTVDLSIQALA